MVKLSFSHAARPLKPKVMVHDPRVPRDEALLLDLAVEPHLGIRRAMPVAELPRAAAEYLGPRHRMTWYFEASGRAGDDGADDMSAHGPATQH